MKRAIVILLAMARTASAHPLDLAYLHVDARDRDVTITLDLEAGFARSLGGDPLALALASDRLAPIEAAGAPCAWGDATSSTAGTTTTLVDHATCAAPVRALRWDLPLVARGSSRFQILARVRIADEESVAVVDRARPALIAGDASVSMLDFVRTGVAHIGVAASEWRGPRLPDGLDHILFVIALLLGGGTLRRLAGVITAFTAGHTISLAIATLGLARPPPSIIEPLIAASIAYVAAQALLRRPDEHRWKIAMGFGLVHGFGFAGALAQLDLSTADTVRALVGFNAGVELGQLAIIAAVLPLVALAHRSRAQALVTRVAPALIFAAGAYWCVARLVS